MFCTLNLFPRYSVKRSPTIILNKRENIQTLSSIFKTPLLYVATQLLCLLPCQPPKIQYPSSQHDRIFRHPTQTQNIIINGIELSAKHRDCIILKNVSDKFSQSQIPIFDRSNSPIKPQQR